MKYLGLILMGMLINAPAFAQDKVEEAPKLRELVTCFPAKGIAQFVSKFQNIDADKRDTVDMLFEAKFNVKDGGVMPSRIFMRDQGVESDFVLDAEGHVPDFINIAKTSETAELCIEDPSRVGTPRGGDDMSFSLDNDVHFLTNSGYHDMATLKDGLKDGKTHYKKMVPGAIRMLVPNLKYVMIEYEVEDTVPQYSAMKGQTALEGLDHVTFCDLPMIKVKDIESLGADGLKVTGGAYKLTPVPGVKTLARFTECSPDSEKDNDEESDE